MVPAQWATLPVRGLICFAIFIGKDCYLHKILTEIYRMRIKYYFETYCIPFSKRLDSYIYAIFSVLLFDKVFFKALFSIIHV